MVTVVISGQELWGTPTPFLFYDKKQTKTTIVVFDQENT